MNNDNIVKSGSAVIISFLVFITIFEGFFVKSFLFTGEDPVIFHYVSSSVLIILCIFISFHKNWVFYINYFLILFIFCFLWLGISTIEKNQNIEYIAFFTFMLLILGFFYSIPIICKSYGISIFEIIYIIITIFSVLSFLMYIFADGYAYDTASGRFSGALISTAVACNVFSLFTIWSFYKSQKISETGTKSFFYLLVILGFFLLYLTKTRSSMVEAIIGTVLLWIGFRLQSAGIYKLKPARWLMPFLVVISTLGMGTFFISGVLDSSKELEEFRLYDNSIIDARDGNWEFGLERIAAKPLFGEGLLTKQTQGGSLTLDVDVGGTYDPRYDPHNLILSLAVQAGIPFAFVMLLIIFLSLSLFVRRFGLSASLRSPEFVFCSLKTLVMIPAGGDLTSFGNSVDRVYWIILGYLVVTAFLHHGDHRTNATQPLLPKSRVSLA